MSHNMQERIEQKLKSAFMPDYLEIIDESYKHRAHFDKKQPHRAGERETHFLIKIKAACFAGQSRVSVHRAVYACLKEEMATKIHALSLELV